MVFCPLCEKRAHQLCCWLIKNQVSIIAIFMMIIVYWSSPMKLIYPAVCLLSIYWLKLEMLAAAFVFIFNLHHGGSFDLHDLLLLTFWLLDHDLDFAAWSFWTNLQHDMTIISWWFVYFVLLLIIHFLVQACFLWSDNWYNAN